LTCAQFGANTGARTRGGPRAATAGVAIRMDRRPIRLVILSSFMNPKLAAVAGPKLGTVIPLDETRTEVGRDAANGLCLPSR